MCTVTLDRWSEDPPLPCQVHTTCSIMMEKSIWSSGLLQIYKSCSNAFEISSVWPFRWESVSPLCISLEVLPWGISILWLLFPLGARNIMGITDVIDSFANLVRSSAAKGINFTGILFKVDQLGFPLFITGFNNCVFKMSKVKCSAECDFTLFQAPVQLIKSAGGTILNKLRTLLHFFYSFRFISLETSR